MKFSGVRQNCAGLTWTEILVTLVALVGLVAMVGPMLRGDYLRSASTQALSNMRQLQMATQQMTLDGATAGNQTPGWPGTNSYQWWVRNLVPSYLATNDFLKLMSGPEEPNATIRMARRWWTGPPSPASMTANTNAVLVYGVTAESGSKVIFLSTANLSNTATGGVLRTNVAPLEGEVFVVMYKGGDGAILRPEQARDANVLGGYAPLLR